MRFSFSIFVFFSLLFSAFPAHSQERLEDLDIITREEWNALPPAKEMIRHVPTMITIHHTGTNQNLSKSTEEKLRDLQKFSFSEGFLGNGMPKKPWADVPYHYYIAADGSLAEGREIGFEGDSNTDYDLTGHLLIVLEGNFDKIELPDVQREKLEKLVAVVAQKWHIPAEKISGHKDQAETSCPGKNLYEFLPVLRQQQKERDDDRVIIGAERLLTPEFIDLVKGKRVGLVTNHTGLLPNGKHLIDVLNDHPEVDLTLLFGPEHGLRGEADAHVSNGVDASTGLPIISLYGEIRKPTPEMLEKTDILIFDIQDIGARYYTYIKTMLLAEEAAAEAGIPFIVLDRPNPITGTKVEGPIGKALAPKTGIGNIPVTHGMTVGELALLFNAERKEKGLPEAELHVIPMKNYKRDRWYDETGLPWIKPSPNMLTLNTAMVYPATCLLEGTNISEARGTLF
ncbi:MAG TPA: exo-beta-N-acetylmuramidase NamZ domain-containing protein, partial [Salinimicrobium sp.]|nr:exo-beta-N-acetylmuramidase NamZ domain-containing protein [Salinimicrobium sp.]